jgi:hypothetical protein
MSMGYPGLRFPRGASAQFLERHRDLLAREMHLHGQSLRVRGAAIRTTVVTCHPCSRYLGHARDAVGLRAHGGISLACDHAPFLIGPARSREKCALRGEGVRTPNQKARGRCAQRWGEPISCVIPCPTSAHIIHGAYRQCGGRLLRSVHKTLGAHVCLGRPRLNPGQGARTHTPPRPSARGFMRARARLVSERVRMRSYGHRCAHKSAVCGAKPCPWFARAGPHCGSIRG